MSNYDTDPAAEIKRLKAQEKAKLNPAVWPAPVKAEKWPKAEKPAKKGWPAALDWAKLKKALPQVWRPLVEDIEYAPWQPGGVPTADVIRAALILGALIAVALGVD